MRVSDIGEALALLTRLPVRVVDFRGIASAWAWPVAGGIVGFLGALVAVVGESLGLPVGIAAGLALAVMVAVTGAMHEDGLADCADGFWGGQDAARRLEIMKDSQIGSYGTLALVLSVLLRWQAIVVLIGAGWVVAPLVVAGALSRAPMGLIMAYVAPAREGGLSAGYGQPEPDTVILGGVVALIAAVLLAGFAGIFAGVLAGGVAFALAVLARARIGGQTGDVMGAAQQLGEIAVLAMLAASV